MFVDAYRAPCFYILCELNIDCVRNPGRWVVIVCSCVASCSLCSLAHVGNVWRLRLVLDITTTQTYAVNAEWRVGIYFACDKIYWYIARRKHEVAAESWLGCNWHWTLGVIPSTVGTHIILADRHIIVDGLLICLRYVSYLSQVCSTQMVRVRRIDLTRLVAKLVLYTLLRSLQQVQLIVICFR